LPALLVVPDKETPAKSWISRVKDIQFDPSMFTLVCANCHAIDRAATVKERHDTLQDILKKDIHNNTSQIIKEDPAEVTRRQMEIARKVMAEGERRRQQQQAKYEAEEALHDDTTPVEFQITCHVNTIGSIEDTQAITTVSE
jgi:hypothetical protein